METCEAIIVAMRAESSEKSEMVNHILFGEQFSVTEEKGDWVLIKLFHDNYLGWCYRNQLIVSKNTHINSTLLYKNIVTSQTALIEYNNNIKFSILKGSVLNVVNVECSDDATLKLIEGETKELNKITTQSIIKTALSYLNAPYLWGGRSPFGIDCSGFVQMVYRLNGYFLNRDTVKQIEHGSVVSFIEEAKAGDLAFFDNDESKIVHVGIIIDNKSIIHASGYVKIDNIDHYGIFNRELNKYTHKLRVIKRVL